MANLPTIIATVATSDGTFGIIDGIAISDGKSLPSMMTNLLGAIQVEASSLEASRPRGFEPDGATMPRNGSILEPFGAIRFEASSLEASKHRALKPDCATMPKHAGILLNFCAIRLEASSLDASSPRAP